MVGALNSSSPHPTVPRPAPAPSHLPAELITLPQAQGVLTARQDGKEVDIS